VVGTQLANERAPARGAGTAGGIDKGAARMIRALLSGMRIFGPRG
jgi:hypothetical protein